MEQPNFDARHCKCKQKVVEIQAGDVSNIISCPSPMYHMLKWLNKHR